MKNRSKKVASNSSSRKTILTAFHVYLTWLADHCKVDRVSILPLLKYGEKLLTIFNTRGKPQVITYNKGNRLNLLKYIFSLDESFEPGDPTRSKILRPFASIIQNYKSYPLIRLILTAFYITRGLRYWKEPDFESIVTKPSREDSYYDTFEKDLFHFLKNKLRINPKHMGSPPKSIRFKNYHMTSKSGPSGHALWSSFLDLWNLPTHLCRPIYYIGGKDLEGRMHKFYLLSKLIPDFFLRLLPRKGSKTLRRISIITDKEGKTREVAIGDYWSQTVLRPVNKYLFKLLLRIPQDCTQNQGKLLCKLTKTEGSSFHSIDLSKATDRFPIRICYLLFKILFGSTWAACWKHIMVYLPYEYKNRNYRYETGTPMGMYTSWASFALCHHFLVYLACKRARIKWETAPYMLLGDDIVIADDRIAKEYKQLLVDWDIPFSPEKTHTSVNGYEFAKQIILHGKNVSPFPLAALYERRNSPLEAVGIILSELWSKDWDIPIDRLLESYYVKICRWPKRRFKAFKPSLTLVISLLAYFKGLSNLGTVIMKYVNDWTKREWKVSSVIQRAYARWLAVKTIHKLFIESRDRVTDYNNKLPLGALATNMVIEITGLKTEVDPFDFIRAVPFLQIYGRAEELYIKLQGDLNDKGLGGDTDIRKYIGKVDIPLSDRDFYVRHRDVILVRALKSGKILEELIRTTPQVVSWHGRLDFTLPWYEYTTYEGELLPDRRMPTQGDH